MNAIKNENPHQTAARKFTLATLQLALFIWAIPNTLMLARSSSSDPGTFQSVGSMAIAAIVTAGLLVWAIRNIALAISLEISEPQPL